MDNYSKGDNDISNIIHKVDDPSSFVNQMKINQENKFMNMG